MEEPIVKKYLYPIVKFRSAETYPDRLHDVSAVVVRMQEFLLENGKPNLSALKKVERAGSLHESLDFSGRIILSSIMPDRILLKINYETYEFLTDILQPDQQITPDGITYSEFIKLARSQINHILGITEKLLNHFPEIIPIGLVKGSNLSQRDFHLDKLLDLGISHICFHAGDFLYRESDYSKDQAVRLANYIHEKVPQLTIYGVGSSLNFHRFNFANSFITNSHYVQAFNHKKICGNNWVNFREKPTKEIVMNNFEHLQRVVNRTNSQRDFTEWTAVTDPIRSVATGMDVTMLESKMKILGGMKNG
jgi:hypothetical protein